MKYFLKKLAHAYLVRQYFLSLLAGKLRQTEQNAGVTQFMKIFRRSKNQITQRQQTLSQRMCKRHKVRLSIFSTQKRKLNQRMCKRHKVRLRIFFDFLQILNLTKSRLKIIVHVSGHSTQRCELIYTMVLHWFQVCRLCWFRKSFIQSNSVQSLGFSLFLGFFSQSLASNTVWKDKQKSKYYCCFSYSITDKVKRIRSLSQVVY